MKRLSIITLLIFIISLPGYSQIWIDFKWNQPNCPSCTWMANALRLNPKQAKSYQKIIHKYGKKIQKEARRDYRHWDKASRNIYYYRMDRDNAIKRMLSPNQFRLYLRLVREQPQRVHDQRGWYENPRYAGRPILRGWRNYDNDYWTFNWELQLRSEQPRHEPSRVEPQRPQNNPNNRYDNGRSNQQNDNRNNNNRPNQNGRR